MRCFIALGWRDGPAAALAPWLERTRAEFPELAVTPPGNLHLTLAFLGEIDDDAVAAATATVEATAAVSSGWTLRWGAPGFFPSRSRPRVAWLGVDSADRSLASVHRRLATELTARGLPPESRAFTPHLTLGRLRRPLAPHRAAGLAVHLATLPVPGPAAVESLCLYRSILGGPHARHEILTSAGMI